LFHSYAGGKAFKDDREINMESGEGKVINDESLLLIHSRFHQYYNPSFPGKIRNFGCTTAHICYVAMGRAEGAIVANESFQDLAAGQIIIESAGGKIIKMDGSDFYLSDYQNGQKINEHLIACPPDLCESIRNSITPAG
jgi:myo-inositol-1(or 4)-monophosphatase